MGYINRGPVPPAWGSLESETGRYGHEFRGAEIRKLLSWRGTEAVKIRQTRPLVKDGAHFKKHATV
jgi:hypothetical protein